ncbi:hypothetical protein [Nocardia fusca]|uniref:Short subunit dehydrogenase n=1 Tax=Nocardia fusca TaxID=941183 RepID=A0ABV3F0B9_9NOCA
MIVVTNATGNVGGEPARIVTAAGAQVTAVSRRPGPLPDGAAHRAEQIRDEACAQLLAFMPEPVADGTLAVVGEPLPIAPDATRVLDRAPRTFADRAVRTAAYQ